MRARTCRASTACRRGRLPFRIVGPQPCRRVKHPRLATVARRAAEDAKLAEVGRLARDGQLHHASVIERERPADDELVQTRPREPQRVGPGVERHLDERGGGQDGHALDPVIREIRGRLAVEPGLVRGLRGGEAAREKRVTAPGAAVTWPAARPAAGEPTRGG